MPAPIPPKPFAKLFDTADGQLLAFLDDCHEDAPCVHVVGASVNGAQPSAIMSGWPDPDGAQKAFEKIDQAMADKTARDLRNAVLGLSEPGK